MRLSKRIVQASWWEGIVLALWCVELGLVLLVGKAMLRKTLSSLSLNGSVCLPTLLVVWPEMAQPGSYWLLHGARFWGGNGGLQEGPCQ